MDFDFSPFLAKYEQIRANADKAFVQVSAAHPQQVRCGLGCSDCCHALFDLSLVEAMALNTAFNAKFSGTQRSAILARADEAERQGEKFKREAHKALKEGRPTTEILALIAKARVRCPLLGENDTCDLYEHRPITCRLYGIPTDIGGEAHTCGKSGFTPGQPYPTVRVEKLQDALMALSAEMVKTMPTRHRRMADVLVPVATALMNAYDKEYLGLVEPKADAKAKAAAKPKPAPAPRPAARTKAAAAPADCSACGQEQGSDQCSSCATMNWELGAKPEAPKARAACKAKAAPKKAAPKKPAKG
ncbi:MAG: YkgJ family cysteine cluster protein [Thermodesulfobacteriota bacterium]